MTKYTLNGIPIDKVSLKDAMAYCFEHERAFVASSDQRQFDCLVEILNGTIEVTDLPDYGMSDQDLEKQTIG